MADLDVSVLLTRPELSLTPLELNDEENYTIIRNGIGLGSVVRKRLTSDSPWVEGRTLIHQVKEQVTVPLAVRVHGSSNNDLAVKVSNLLRALDQFSYRITVTIGGVVWGQYDCEAADYSVGDSGVFQDLHYRSLIQEVSAEIPRMPTPVSGVY